MKTINKKWALMVNGYFLHSGYILFQYINEPELYTFDSFSEAREFADGVSEDIGQKVSVVEI